jgi:hypothetical protein
VDQIFVTREAADVLRPHLTSDLRARLEHVGRLELAKDFGSQEVFWLGDEREEPPIELSRIQYTVQVSPHTMTQFASLRGANDLVERFHVYSHTAGNPKELTRSFGEYRHEILNTLRIPARRDKEVSTLEADVMHLEETGLLRIVATTAPTHKRLVPRMKVDMHSGAEPKAGSGVAAYAAWGSKNGKLGVAVASNVVESRDGVYFQRSTGKNGTVGQYELNHIPDLYKPVPDARADKPIPYKSIMSTAILLTLRSGRRPEDKGGYTCYGVLNLTSSLARAFTAEDCAWAEGAAGLIAALHQSYLTSTLVQEPSFHNPDLERSEVSNGRQEKEVGRSKKSRKKKEGKAKR